MRVLTLTAEWAEAIFALGKNVENRTWSTTYRGPVAILAGKKVDCSLALSLGLDPNKLTRGAIIGVVEVVDCIRDSKSRWAMSGHYHWVLRNPRRTSTPIPMTGSLGLRNLHMDISDHVLSVSCQPV
jgi:hypothetical protein